jgi:hypothetical protein
VHHSRRTFEATPDFASRSRMVELLGSYARFYELHGRLLGPFLFDHFPDLRAQDGSCDLAAARVLMELVSARGVDWAFMTWMNGDLGGLLAANRRRVKLRAVEAALEREREEVLRLSEELASVSARAADDARTIEALNARLRRIEGSVTWQLFQHVRKRTFAMLGGEQSRGVALLQKALRLLGRALGHGRPGGEVRNSVEGPAPPSDLSRIEVRDANARYAAREDVRVARAADTSRNAR